MRRMTLLLAVIAIAFLSEAPVVLAQVANLAVNDIQPVSSRRVGRTNYEYTFTAAVSNAGGALNNVVGTVSSVNPVTQVVEGVVVFGNILSGETSSPDTFTVVHNRRYVFDQSNLVWSFTADEPSSNTPPTADAGPDQAVDEGSVVSLFGGGSFDPDGDSIAYSWMLSIPVGSSASLTGDQTESPSFTADIPGIYIATLVVSDGADSSTPDSVTITARDVFVNTPPVADAGPDQMVSIGSPVNLNGLGSTDGDGDPLTFQWNLTVPAGSAAALSDSTSPTPSFTADIAGSYLATLVVNDGIDDSALDGTTVTAIFSGNNPPEITSSANTSGSVGEAYAYNVTATDPDLGDVLTYSLQLAPAGMSMNSVTGMISWTPGVAGPADVDVLVTDSVGLTDRQIYLLVVNNGDGDQPPSIAPIANQVTVINQTVMATAAGFDPEGEALRYGITASPAGLVVNVATGAVSWTPTAAQAGNYSATVTVTDPGGQSAATSFSIEVLAESFNSPPVIDPVADISIGPQTTIQRTLAATDGDENDVLTFSLDGAPAGMQFDPVSGAFSWTSSSSDAGTVALTAGVTDGAGATDSMTFSITVAQPQLPPVAVDDAYTIDRDFQLQIPALGVLANDTDPNNDPLSASNTSVTTLGTLDSFPGDGGFLYTPPANPNITVGLQFRCQSAGLHGGLMPLVGDWDHDGTTEIIGFNNLNLFNGQVNVLNGADCSLKQPPLNLAYATYGSFPSSTPMAMANLDSDPDLELILVRNGPPGGGTDKARLVAINIGDGSLVWSLPDGASESVSLPLPNGGLNYYYGIGPTVIDLDGDGSTEILMPLSYSPSSVFGALGAVIAYNSDGTIRWEFSGAEQGGDHDEKPLAVVDLDLDGTVEIIYHTNVIDHNGNLEFSLQTDQGSNFLPQHLTVAIANFDNDPFPEILGRDSVNIYLFEHTPGPPTWTVPNVEFSGATSEMTIGDFDGDGQPEFAFHGGSGTGPGRSYITAFDTDGSEMWSHRDTVYRSSAAELNIGITTVAFDYDRDGIDEITSYLRTDAPAVSGVFIFRGDTGLEVARYAAPFPNSILAGRQIFPLIADLDDDGAAEITYPIAPNLGIGPLYIVEGIAANPFPPARAIRNQLINQPTHVGLDGYIPAYPAPQWLIPGLNQYNGVAVVPFEDPGLTDAFTYYADDGVASSNEATVSIAVTNVNAPTIISNPPLGASPGFPYSYGALATDGDFGDVFAWALVDAPQGMTLNQFGVTDWAPQQADLGTHRVHIVVTDLQGNSDEQSYEIAVVPPVTVPPLIGLDEATAGDALIDAGLAVGSVTQGYSFTVPVGQVISQSVTDGLTSAAGAFINYVISLGPRPILVPTLTDLSQSAAEAVVESTGLLLGNVTRANSDTAPAGVVVTQSIAPFTEVAFESVIDVTISSGPALLVTLDQVIVGSGDTIAASVTVFDNDGIPLAPQPPVVITVAPDVGAVGALPVAGTTAVTTSADTRGSFRFEVDAGVLGSASIPFIVRSGLVPGDYFEPIAQFAETIDDVVTVYSQLVVAVESNDVFAIQSLAQQLVVLRDGVDPEALAKINAFAPEVGFIPTYLQSAASGFSAGFGELDQGSVLYSTLENSIEENISFLENLNPALGRNDDIRARALNNSLSSRITQFNSQVGGYSVGARVYYNAENYVLLSQLVPQMVYADLQAMIGVLADNGFLAMQLDADDSARFANQTPAEFYRETRNAFFSFGGLMTASSIRMTLIKDLYVPHITRLVSASLVLEAASALLADQTVGPIAGIITGASLSFHIFNADNSVVEIPGLSRDSRSFTVLVIGPDRYQAALEAILEFGIPESLEDVADLGQTLEDIASSSEAGIQTAQVHDRIRGCILDSSPECIELVLGFGFPVVHTSGVFPAPVLVIVDDRTQGKKYAGAFAFFPN